MKRFGHQKFTSMNFQLDICNLPNDEVHCTHRHLTGRNTLLKIVPASQGKHLNVLAQLEVI